MSHTPRIYHSGHAPPGPLTLKGDEAARLASVMRLKPGDEFLVFSGDGREWRATVTSASKDLVTATTTQLTRQGNPPAVVLETWIGVIRPNRFEVALEKCVEAGADIIRAVVCEFSQRGDDVSPAKAQRWQRIVVEAAEQSGRLYVPVLLPAVSLTRALEGFGGSLIVGEPGGQSPAEVQRLLPMSGHLAFVVGPEGGLSPGEVASLRQRGAVPVSLGPYILRTETAAIAGTAMLRSLT